MIRRSASATRISKLGISIRPLENANAGALSGPARARSLYTLSTASSVCCKGSLSYFNRNGGDDAFVNSTWIVPGPHQGAALLGVADGVGGWKKYGVDPGKISRALCREITCGFEAEEGHSDIVPGPKGLLESAWMTLKSRGHYYAGGTTVCIGTFDPSSGVLTVANIGDSGFLVLRRGRIMFASERDSVGLAPRQLAIPAKEQIDLARNTLLESGKPLRHPPWMLTSPRDVTITQLELQHGDVLVFGTDGLFDNVYNSFILQSVSASLVASSSWTESAGKLLAGAFVSGAPKISEMLLKRAYYNSLDPNYASPFATNSFQNGLVLPGGKPDDISVLVSTVNEVKDVAGDYELTPDETSYGTAALA